MHLKASIDRLHNRQKVKKRIEIVNFITTALKSILKLEKLLKN